MSLRMNDGAAAPESAAPEVNCTLPTKPTRERWKVLAWLSCIAVFTYIGRIGISGQIRENIESDLHLVPALTAYAISAFTLSYALFELPSGFLGDRFGPRKVLTRIVMCWMVFTALTAAAWNLGSLIAVRFMVGAGEAGAFPNIARATREWFPFRERGLAQGLVWMMARFGGAITFPLLLALSRFFGWRGAFVVTGAFGVVWVIFFWMRFRDRPSEDQRVNTAERALIAEGKAAQAKKAAPLSWSTLFGSSTMWFLLLMYFASNAGWSFFASWITPYLEKDLHLKGMALAVGSGAPLFFGGIACLIGGLLTDRLVRTWGRRWGRTLIGTVGYAIAGAMMLVALIYKSNPAIALAAVCFSSFAKDLGMASTWAITIDIGHSYSGTVSGLMNSIGNLAQVISVPVVAQLAIWAGTRGEMNWNISLYYYGAMFFISSFALIFIDPRRTVVYSPEDRMRLESEGLLSR